MSEKTTLQGLSEIASFLGLPATVHRTTIRRWIDDEGLPAFEVNGRWWSDPDALDAWWTGRRARLQATG